MTSRIERISRASSPRKASRAESGRAEPSEAAAPANLPVPAGPVRRAPRPAAPTGDAAFEAQLLGQEGQKRGLRGGKPVLDAARNTYNGVEWSGAWDRRARKGRKARTEV